MSRKGRTGPGSSSLPRPIWRPSWVYRPTLREALFNLEQEGIILRKHGVGTFVAPTCARRVRSGLERLESILALAERQGMSTQVVRLRVKPVFADDEVAEKLKLEAGTAMTRVCRTIAVDASLAAYLVAFISAAVLPPNSIDESFGGSVRSLLARRGDFHIHEALAEITAVNADRFLAEQLRTDPGEALLMLSETLYTEDLAPIEFSRNYFLPGLFDFHILRH